MSLRPRHLAALALLAAWAGLGWQALPLLRFQGGDASAAQALWLEGAIHVHLPARPDATGALLQTAWEAGLDFVVLAAAEFGDPLREGLEGYYTPRGLAAGGQSRPPLLVLAGVEAASDRGPLLLLPGDAGLDLPRTLRGDRLVAAVEAGGGVAIALAPCARHPEPHAGPPPARLVEALSLAGDFRPVSYPGALAGAVLDRLRPLAALAAAARRPADGRPPDPQLAWRGPSYPLAGVGLGEELLSDPEAARLRLGWLRTLLLPERPPMRQAEGFSGDRTAVLDALRGGRAVGMVSGWRHGPALGLDFGEARIVAGAGLPAEARVILRRDGMVMADGPAPVAAASGDGAWRAEAYLERRHLGLPGAGWVLWQVSAAVAP